MIAPVLSAIGSHYVSILVLLVAATLFMMVYVVYRNLRYGGPRLRMADTRVGRSLCSFCEQRDTAIYYHGDPICVHCHAELLP